jgi:hypothetical protein
MLRTCVGATGILPVPAKWVEATKMELISREHGDLVGVQTQAEV